MIATYTLSPNVKRVFFTDSGVPVALGLLYTVSSGGSYPADAVTTYQTPTGTAHSNPIVLDAAGRISGSQEIYLTPGESFKFILKTAAGGTIWTQDGIAAVPPSTANADILATAGENLAAGDVVYMARGTEGGTTAGFYYKTDADAEATSSSALTVGMTPNAILQNEDGIIRLVGDVTVTGPLTPGAPYWASATAGALTGTEPTRSRYIGQSKTATVITLPPNGAAGSGGGFDYLQLSVFGS